MDSQLLNEESGPHVCKWADFARWQITCEDGQKLNVPYSSVLKELSSSELEHVDVIPARSDYAPQVLSAAISFSDDFREGLSKAICCAGYHNYCPPIMRALIEVRKKH